MDIPNYDPNEIRMSNSECPSSPSGTHDLEMVPNSQREPSCAVAGKEADYKCKYCPYTEKGQETSKSSSHTGTKVDVAAVPATCSSTGKTAGKECSVCHTILEGCTTVPVNPNNHNVVDNKCTLCGATFGGNSSGAQSAPPSDDPADPNADPNTDTNADPNADTNADPNADPNTDTNADPDADPNVTPEDGERIEVSGETVAVPVTDDEKTEFHLCNPITCGCWIYLILALVIGIVTGFLIGSHSKKKKAKKRRSRSYTEVDFAAPMPTVAEPAVMPVVQQPSATGVTAAVHHHIGARKDQQDSYGVSDLNAYATTGVLAVVADGMGGLANGKAVSSNLVHGMLNYFRHTTGQESVPDMMLDMLTQSNDQINRMLQGADRSGSTLVAAIVRGGQMYFLTVGDSRIYLYRHGLLLQLNREHIYQEELALKAVNHIIPLAQVTGDRQAHALTSYLGIGRLTHLDRNYEGIKLEPGDKIMLASDGVFGTLSQAEMEAALRNSIGEATDIIGEKIRIANMQYQDNNTALVLEYHG